LSTQLPLRVDRRVLALNKVSVSGEGIKVPDGPTEWPQIQAVVQVPYDSDLAERSSCGAPIDAGAGPTAREAIARLAHDCLVVSH
jgi:hypothetical protein